MKKYIFLIMVFICFDSLAQNVTPKNTIIQKRIDSLYLEIDSLNSVADTIGRIEYSIPFMDGYLIAGNHYTTEKFATVLFNVELFGLQYLNLLDKYYDNAWRIENYVLKQIVDVYMKSIFKDKVDILE